MLRRKAIELLMFAVKSPKTSHYRQLLLISEEKLLSSNQVAATPDVLSVQP